MRQWLLVAILLLEVYAVSEAQRRPEDEPLLDWTACYQYRDSITHPAGVIKPADVDRARANIARYAWAQRYAAGVEAQARARLSELTPEYIVRMIPETTPGDTLFTPCPACRDQGKPAHPHGQWHWPVEDPDHLVCKVCGTVFPNDQYPESIVLRTTYGKPQELSFYGGPGFQIFSYVGRPSFSGNIRACKVAYMVGVLRNCAEAYLLTGDVEFATAVRAILLRLADVYPNWLVHVGYGEYADMDPHIAALNIDNLPADELTPGPTKPDRKLHTGYWSAGRSSAVGMDAGFVRAVTEAYDFTCEAQRDGQPLYTEDERRRIERNLILESTVLLVADKSVNNKSVGNATAVALVGMTLGHPGMVRFGLDVFMDTVNEWFLADGGTSESWSYAEMTLSGIWALGQAFRGYSDPPGYADAAGQRLQGIDLYHDTNYKLAWQAMFNGLQGDLRYPPLADGHKTSALGADFVELMAANYPENEQYMALLREVAGPDLARGHAHHALYFREPGLEEKPSPPLTLPDYVFPALQIGYLRSGHTGRDSALVLSASDWGGHHHNDSLSLYYWQQGRELLSDLGYLWDHPQSHMTRRTFAHNTVMVDGREQQTVGRGGKFTLFATTDRVKVMEAESRAYPQTSLYRRTVAQVSYAPGRQYVVDIFRVQGGRRHEYVFHGPNNAMTVQGPELVQGGPAVQPVRGCVRLWVNQENVAFQVDDVTLSGPDGANVFPNPQATGLDAQSGKPAGFGYYRGDGEAEWGQVTEGHGDNTSVGLRVTRPGAQRVNVALLLGDSDGYSGPRALELLPGVEYRLSFWIKGTAPNVQVELLYWPSDPTDANNRVYQALSGARVVSAEAEWQQVEATFTIPDVVDMKNVRQAAAVAPWRLSWDLDEQFVLSALWTNESGQTTLLGDGWGQRDYRNSDVGATLPYIVRRAPAGEQATVFATVFEGHAPGEGLVRSVRLVPVPEAQAVNAAVVAVETEEGTDYLISCLEPRPLTVSLPEGPVDFAGRFAMVSARDGRLTEAAVVQGQ